MSTGTVSLVLPQNWLFLTTYKKFCEQLLRNDTWQMIAKLGPQAFQTPMWNFNVQLLILSRGNKVEEASSLFSKRQDAAATIASLDVSAPRTAKEKAELLLKAEIQEVEQEQQLENPDARIVFSEKRFGKNNEIEVHRGSHPGQTPRVVRYFWELTIPSEGWVRLETTPNENTSFSGKTSIIYSLDKIQQKNITEFGKRGYAAWGKKGVIVSQMNNLPGCIYCGEVFDNNTKVVTCQNEENTLSFWCYVESKCFLNDVRGLNQKLDVSKEAISKVPFDLEYWQKVASKKYPDGLPKPYSDDPTQWIFHGHPAKVAEASSLCNQRQDAAATLQVAVARLLGYRWPAELDVEMELSNEQREWVAKCADLLEYVDEDGIVCIPLVRGEEPATDRLQKFLVAVHESGSGFQPLNNQRQDAAATILPATFQDWLNKLLAQANPAGKTLDEWLRDHFFEQHCKLFHHRPFIWHIWDGRRRDGFHALVNYHKLAEGNGKGRQLLENLTYSYLGDWITRQREGVKRGEGGAEDRLAAALELQKRLITIIEGEPPFDIFVRWKPIEKQPIGWEPDINDGVRLNIRPFMADDIPGGRKGAGIFRWKPNIKWNKDRGKDVASAPWFPLFKGDRINDHHLSLEEKRAARAEANRR